jgi:hypothetical protein
MMKRSLRGVLGLTFLLTLQVAACAPEERRDIDRVADFYVERMLDSLRPDTVPVDSLLPDSLPPDSLLPDSVAVDTVSDSLPAKRLALDSLTLDSLTADWTAEDWVNFWSKVEQKRARQAKSAENAAGR